MAPPPVPVPGGAEGSAIRRRRKEALMSTQPRILCIAGPTACGKTRMGVLLAKRFSGEVVSVD